MNTNTMKKTATLILRGTVALGIIIFAGFMLFYDPQQESLDPSVKVQAMLAAILIAAGIALSMREA